jgi:4-amino-4-deoxy-L-arabinose transferase-like glycosyltransferase
MRNYAPGALSHDAYWHMNPGERWQRAARLDSIPAAWRSSEAPFAQLIYEAQQPPLYYWLLAPFLVLFDGASLTARVFLLRLVSVLLSSATVPLAFAVGRRVLGTRAGIGIAACIAVFPAVMINVARVGNDGFSMAIYTALVYVTLRALDEPLRRRWWVLAGVVLGAGLLTKAFFLAAAGSLALIAFGTWLRTRTPRRRITSGVFAAFALATAIGSWWYVHIHRLTGTWTGQVQTVDARHFSAAERLIAILHVDWLRVFDTILVSHLWFGASSFLQVRSWMYHAFAWAMLAAGVGLAVLFVGRVRSGHGRVSKAAVPVLVSYFIVFVGAMLYHALAVYLLTGLSMTNGWYLCCVAVPEIALLAAGWAVLLPERAGRWALAWAGLCFAALDLFGIHTLLLPYYTGLIVHDSTGNVRPFNLLHWPVQDWYGIVARLSPVPHAIFAWMWALSVAAVLCAVAFAFASAACPGGRCASGSEDRAYRARL